MSLATIKTESVPQSDKSQLLQIVARELAAGGLSQTQAAKQAGISPTTLSLWMQGKYAGDEDAVTGKVRRWMDGREKRKAAATAMPPAPNYLNMPSGRKIQSVLQFAQSAGDIGGIGGPPGSGKTYTLEHQKETSPNAWLVTMSPDCAGIVPTLEEVAYGIGMRDLPGGAARLRREIVARLQGTAGLLMIDEAQHLSVPSLEVLRTLHDRTGVGLVLCGNETVYGRLTGGKRAEHFAQLFSRIGKWLKLGAPSPADVTAILDHYTISDPEARKLLTAIADKPGALRSMVKTIRLASLYAGRGVVNRQNVQAAWRDLGETS